MANERPQIVDLFSGAGGMSTGFEMAGFEVALGVEYIERFSKTFAKNHPNAITLNKDIREVSEEEVLELLDGKEIDVVIGGPPCQGFSGAGRRDPKGPRNSLFMDFVRIVGALNPTYFVMENVPGILNIRNANDELVVEIIREEFKKVGYSVEWRKLMAADYGVPQKRRRVIFIGCQIDSKSRFPKSPIVFPKPTHASNVEDFGSLDVGLPKLKKWVGAGTVLLSKEDAPEKSFHTQKMIDGFVRRKERNKANGKGFGWQIIDPEKPCYTISARYWKDGSDALVKYSDTEVRILTHGEAAAIQTFPKDYEFIGSSKEIYMQIGNAVPCLLAKAIGDAIIPKFPLSSSEYKELMKIWSEKIKGKKTSEIPMPVQGSLGHWIQEQFGQSLDADKDADWKGLEIKTGRQKMSFGDWTPSQWMWDVRGKSGLHSDVIKSQDDFVRMFGKPLTEQSQRYKRRYEANLKVGTKAYNDKKKSLLGRHSWSSTRPKIGTFNDAGSKLVVKRDDAIEVVYDYAKDLRPNKASIVHEKFHKGVITLARWDAEKMSNHINRKFGQKGWAKFVEKQGIYAEIHLFEPITHSTFLGWVERGIVFFDPGTYEGNPKPYCQWRMNNSDLEKLATRYF